MVAKATIRDLRNQFPKIKRLLDHDGEVIVTDQGTPRYRITRYSAPAPQKPAPKDYLKRLATFQPRPIDVRAAKALHEENRGDR